MMPTTIIGIDPGKSGGVAYVNEFTRVPFAHKLPETIHELVDLLRGIDLEDAKAYIEKVSSSPQMGVTSSFTFGRGLGAIEGVLAALQIPFEWVTPQKWQKSIGCLTGGDKNVSKRKALELFPATKWTHATADCALICEYGRRLETRTAQVAE